MFSTVLCTILDLLRSGGTALRNRWTSSRFLRAVLNERMFEAREYLGGNMKVKADENVEGETCTSKFKLLELDAFSV